MRTLRWSLERSRRPLLRLLAVVVLAAQTAGLVHAADLDAHRAGDVCHACQHQYRAGAPPPVLDSPAPHVAADPVAAPIPPSARAVGAVGLLPPTRAPPR